MSSVGGWKVEARKIASDLATGFDERYGDAVARQEGGGENADRSRADDQHTVCFVPHRKSPLSADLADRYFVYKTDGRGAMQITVNVSHAALFSERRGMTMHLLPAHTVI